MDTAWQQLGPAITAALMLLVCVALMRLGASRAPVVAFVSFMLLRAGVIVFMVVGNLLHGAWTMAAASTIEALDIAMVPALLAFVSVYPRRRGLGRMRWWPLPFAGAAVALTAWATVDPCAAICEERGTFGPLYPFILGAYAVEAAIGVVLVRQASQAEPGHARTAIHLLAIGLLVDAALSSILSASILRGPNAVLDAWDPDPLVWVGALAMPILALLLVAIACTLSLRHALPYARQGVLSITAIVLAGALTKLVDATTVAYPIAIALLSLSRLALPILAALALVRHRLFDIDTTQRRLLRGAAVGSFIAAVFFLAEQAGNYYFGSRYGVLAGVLVSGLFIPLTPQVRRLADATMRLADGGVPSMSKLSPEDRLRLYEEFARDAWADGMLGVSERAFLDDLRSHLGIDASDAARAESAAARSIGNDGEVIS